MSQNTTNYQIGFVSFAVLALAMQLGAYADSCTVWGIYQGPDGIYESLSKSASSCSEASAGLKNEAECSSSNDCKIVGRHDYSKDHFSYGRMIEGQYEWLVLDSISGAYGWNSIYFRAAVGSDSERIRRRDTAMCNAFRVCREKARAKRGAEDCKAVNWTGYNQYGNSCK